MLPLQRPSGAAAVVTRCKQRPMLASSLEVSASPWTFFASRLAPFRVFPSPQALPAFRLATPSRCFSQSRLHVWAAPPGACAREESVAAALQAVLWLDTLLGFATSAA